MPEAPAVCHQVHGDKWGWGLVSVTCMWAKKCKM